MPESLVYNDNFCETHLDKWLEYRFTNKSKEEKVKKAIKDFIIEKGIKQEYNYSWPFLLELAIKNDYISEKEVYCDE